MAARVVHAARNLAAVRGVHRALPLASSGLSSLTRAAAVGGRGSRLALPAAPSGLASPAAFARFSTKAPASPVQSTVEAPASPTRVTRRHLGFVVVNQQEACVVERFGRYWKVLTAGWHFLLPGVDSIAYVHSLKEQAITIPAQSAVTRDNVELRIDGTLYLRVLDPAAASYGVSDPIFALAQLAQTTMRSELGKITLDDIFRERLGLNHAIVTAINAAAATWGTQVLRYEIRDIMPPASVRSAMEMQAEAERRKRAEILDSEGHREATINNAEAKSRSAILVARGEAEAIRARAEASAAAIEMLAGSIGKAGGREAVTLRLAEQYVAAFGRIAKAGNTMLLPASAGDPTAMVAQAMAVWDTVRTRSPLGPSPADALPPNPASHYGFGAAAAAAAAAAEAPASDALSDSSVPATADAEADAAGGGEAVIGDLGAPFVPAPIVLDVHDHGAPRVGGGAYPPSGAAGAADLQQQQQGGAGFTPQPLA